MFQRLPNWVWVGGTSLACVAGIVNAVGFLSFQHQGVTHMTGTTTLFGIAIAHQNYMRMGHLLSVMVAFVVGATLSGYLIQDSALQLGRSYGRALCFESLLLFLAVPLLQKNNVLGAYFASCACGLQNAMASTYSGTTVRTSHVSGYFTDFGIAIGHWLRRSPFDYRRFRFCIIITAGFLIGSIIGGYLFPIFYYKTLYVPAILVGLFGIGYEVYTFG